MKHITSKLLSLLLTLAMLLSMVPAAYAVDDYESNIESEPTSYVMVGGIRGFENQGFESFEAAYNAIKPKLEELCDDDALGQGVADADKFDALFTDKDANGNATLTYTIGGNVTYDETALAHLLTMGRSSSHYSNGRHLINFKFVGADANRGATLVVNSDITLPYEWWGEKIAASISFENLTITGSAPSGLYTYQKFFEGIDFSVNDCTLSGIKIYNCANVGGSYRITNSTLDGTGAAANAYAIHLQGNETAPLSITISNNDISGYDRGINIDQATADATISGNTIFINDTNRSCIQLTQLAETAVTGNTLKLTGGNAITLHENLAADSKINFTGNTVSGTGYLIYDNTRSDIALTYGENSVAETVDTTKGIYGGETKVVSEAVSKVVNGGTEPTVVAKIGSTGYETLTDAIANVKDGETIVVNAGTYVIPASQTVYAGKAFTIEAAADAEVIFDMPDVEKAYITMSNAKVTFNRVTFNYKNKDYVGLAHTDTLVYNNCVINGKVFLYAASETFNRCTFNQVAEDYNVWTYGAQKVAFNDCTFKCNGKAVNVYIEEGNASTEAKTIEVKNVTVESNKADKAFLNIKNKTQAYDVTFSGTNTVNGLSENDTTKSNLFQVETTDISTSGNTVTVKKVQEDGTLNTVYEVKVPSTAVAKVGDTEYATLKEAIAAAKDGETVTLLDDITLTSAQSISKQLTLDLNGKTLSSTAIQTIKLNANADLTVKDNAGGGKVTNADPYLNRLNKPSSTKPAVIQLNSAGAKFTLESGIIESNELRNDLYSKAIENTTSGACTVNIKGGQVIVPDVTPKSRAIVAGNGMTLNISGGTITGGLCGVDAYSGSTVNITGGTISATYVDTGVVKEAFGMRIIGTADVTIDGGEITGVKMDDNGSKLDVPNVTLKSGTINGSFYSITNGTIVFTVAPTAEIILENTTASAFLPEGVKLTQNPDGTYGVTKATAYVAEIVDKDKYETLEAAFAAAVDGDTITLLSNCSGNGIVVEDSAFPSGLTVDFAGYTYTVSGRLVGSNNSETNGFQLKKGNKITFTNGTITSADTCTGKMSGNRVWTGAAAILLQNYCDLTLDGMTVTGGNATCYTMSNNNGKTFIKDSTIIAGKNTNNVSGPFAFDVCGFSSYDGVSVTVKGNSVINGDIEVSRSGNTKDVKLALESGTITGELKIDSSIKSGDKTTITKSNDVIISIPAGYLWVEDENTSTLAKAVVAIGDKQYASLAEAVEAAKSGETVTLLSDIDLDEQIATGKAITIDGQGKYTIKATTKLVNTNGKAGMFYRTTSAQGTLTFLNVTLDGNGLSKIFLNEGGAGETVFDGVTSTNGGGIAYGSGIHISGGGSHATIKNSTLTGSKGTMELNNTNYYAANDLWVGGNVYVTVENSTIGTVFVNSAPTATATNGVVHGQLTITGENTKITYLSGEEEAADKLDKFGNNGSLVKIDSGYVETIFDKGSYEISGGTFKTEVKSEWCADGFAPVANSDGTYGVEAYTPIEVRTGYAATTGAGYTTIAEAAENLGENKWIVVAKDYTLTDNFTIPKGVFLDIAAGATLTVKDGVTLTVAADAKRLGVRTGATLVNNGTIMVLGTSSSNGYVMVQDGGNFDVDKLTVPEGYILGKNGSNYFATEALFKITYSDGTVKESGVDWDLTNATKVELLKDVSDFANTISGVADNFVLDLGGHTLSGKETASTQVLQISVPMTITNGTIKYASSNTGSGALMTSADVTIASDAIIDGGAGYAIYTDGYGHTLTVNGTVKCDGAYAITSNGSENGGLIADCSIIVNSSAEISAPNGIAIYHPEKGTVTVNGGTVTGHTGIEMCAGKLVVNDGSIASTGDNWDATGSQNAILDGAAISIINRNYPGGVPTAEINGGTIKATGNGAQTVKAYDYTNNAVAEWTAAGENVNISDGTFSSIPSNMKDLCAEGYTCAKNDDGSYTVRAAAYVAEYNGTKYTSLQEAIDAASQKTGGQAVVTMLGNVTITKTISFVNVSAVSVLLDLNGYTLTGKNCRAIQVNKGNLYLENGTVTSTGIINSSSVIRIGSDDTTYSGSNPALYMRKGAKVLAPDSYGVTIFGSKTVSEQLTVAGNASIEAIGPSPAISGQGGQAYHVDGKGTKVIITGNAVVSATNNYAIYHPDNGTLDIQGGTISGKGGIQMCSGTLKISGSPKIEALGKADHKTGAAGPIYDIAAISAVNRSYPGGAPVVTITGTPAITTTVDGEVIHAYTWNSDKTESTWADAGNYINVSGGTYSKKFNEAYLAADCTLVKNSEGGYTVDQKKVAEYNGTQYTSLAQAFTDARNSGAEATVKLLEDVTVTDNLNISGTTKSIKLNLNKKTLTLDGAQLYTTGLASIDNGTIKRTDVPANGSADYFAIKVNSGSTLNIGLGMYTPVTLESTYGIYNLGGTLNVRFANITTDGWSIAVSDSKTPTGETNKVGVVNIGRNADTTITSKTGNCIGTMVNTKSNVTIYADSTPGVKMTSNGTDWNAGVIYWASEGTLDIKGGTFTASSAEGSTAAAVYQKNGTVKISGSSTKLLGNNALVVKAGEGSTGTMVTELSAGTYSTKPEDSWLAEGKEAHEVNGLYVVEGPYLVEVTIDGTATKYDSWFSAFTESTAKYKNATVKLLKDIETTTQVSTYATVTIDFNGHTLTVNTTDADAVAAITLRTGSAGTANVTLMDSSENAEGGMVTRGPNGFYAVVLAGTNTALTIENGSYDCNTSVVQVTKGTAYIKGGTFEVEDEDKEYLLNCTDKEFAAGTAKMEVTGGTFYGFDPSANPEGPGTTYVKVGYVVKDNGNNVYTVEKSDAEAQIVGTQTFGTLTAMLAEATDGQTVALVNDATVNNWYFAVAPGKTIDLNGNKLTVTGKLYSFGKVIDSTEGKGLLSVTDMAGSQLPKDNGYLPIKDGDGYRLYSYTCIGSQNNSGLKNGAVTFAFSVTMSETAWAKIATDDNSVKVLYRATWGENKKNEVILRFTDSKLNSVGGAAKRYYFTMSVGGLDALNGMALTMTPEIECAFFVNTMASATYNP